MVSYICRVVERSEINIILKVKENDYVINSKIKYE